MSSRVKMPQIYLDLSDPVLVEKKVVELDDSFRNLNIDIVNSLSYVRRAQGITHVQLSERINGLSSSTLRHYLSPGYKANRPLHVVAAMSWLMMVPMTGLYHKFCQMKSYCGLSEDIVHALINVGHLPSDAFATLIQLISNLLDKKNYEDFYSYTLEIEAIHGQSIDSILKNYSTFFPPKVLDIDSFALDYYYSIAMTALEFRTQNHIPVAILARMIGLSISQYRQLEDPNNPVSLPVSLGYRVKYGFQLKTYAPFSSYMRIYKSFHQLRVAQHVRELLIINAISRLHLKKQKALSEIMINLSDIYSKNKN